MLCNSFVAKINVIFYCNMLCYFIYFYNAFLYIYIGRYIKYTYIHDDDDDEKKRKKNEDEKIRNLYENGVFII